jgi:hypothetical protein
VTTQSTLLHKTSSSFRQLYRNREMLTMDLSACQEGLCSIELLKQKVHRRVHRDRHFSLHSTRSLQPKHFNIRISSTPRSPKHSLSVASPPKLCNSHNTKQPRILKNAGDFLMRSITGNHPHCITVYGCHTR